MPFSSTRDPRDLTTQSHHLRRLHYALGFRRGARDTEGFTLIETLAALTILAVGVLGVAAGLLSAMKMASRSREHTQAIYLAEQQLETFLIMPGADVEAMAAGGAVTEDSASPIDPDPGDDNATTYNRFWKIELDEPENDVITITVTVSWKDDKGAGRSTELRTLKAAS
jgi:prepilin-type N-terminal cleavage/methylation domain-containing protein